MFFALDDAWAGDEEKLAGANGDVSDLEGAAGQGLLAFRSSLFALGSDSWRPFAMTGDPAESSVSLLTTAN